MNNRKFNRKSTCTTSSCKIHCVVWFYGNINHRVIFFSRTRFLYFLVLLKSLVSAESVFWATSFQLFNSVYVCKMMEDDMSPHIVNPMKQLLKRHFENVRIISSHFLTAWPSSSPDFIHVISSNLKDFVFSTLIAHLAELKAWIAQHILNVTTETMWSVLKHAVSRFQILEENGG